MIKLFSWSKEAKTHSEWSTSKTFTFTRKGAENAEPNEGAVSAEAAAPVEPQNPAENGESEDPTQQQSL